jgi:hypothetical protein
MTSPDLIGEDGIAYGPGTTAGDFEDVMDTIDRDVVLNASTMSDATLGNIISNLQSKDLPVPVDIAAAADERGLIINNS